MTYTIVLDGRERKLQVACKELVIPYKTDNLLLGDIQIQSETGDICMMIERKTWRDLAASIVDNRYKEQHARYTMWARENQCEVWYLLEGPQKFRTPSQEKRTLSAHLSLSFDRWVNVVETKSPLATMEWIHRVLKKIHAKGLTWISSGFCGTTQQQQQQPMQVGGGNREEAELAQQKSQKIGKKTHSRRATWMAMLSCIYGMSVAKAEAIVSHWDTIGDMIAWIRSTDPKEAVKELQEIPLGKRKLGKALASRIVSMFYYIKDTE